MKKYIGDRIRKARKHKKLTLKEAAEKLDTNVSSLSKIERGEYEASYDMFEKLSQLYDVGVSYFFGENVDIPKELLDVGVEELVIAKEIRDSELNDKEIKQIVDFIKFISSQHVD